jgi:chromosome segregation ATPase
MKPKNKPTQTIHVQSHDWAAENQQLRKELLSREKRIEELEAMASTLNNQLSEKIDQINDLMQKMISFMTTNGDASLLDSLRQSVVTEVRVEFEAREQKLEEAYKHECENLTSYFNARLAVYQGELDRLKETDGEDDPTATIPSTSK